MLLKCLSVFICAYLIGAVPIGWVIVKLFNGKDVREVGSGRVGGTNVIRAAGTIAGFLTYVFDAGKGILAGLVASLIVPDNVWIKVTAVILAVIGQVYSIFLVEKDENGKMKLRGGAGGSTTFGGAVALWPSIAFFIFPIICLVYFCIGYASLTTISIAFFSLVIFAYQAVVGLLPWQFVIYGIASLIIVLYTLRPNLIRLKQGTERVVGLRAYRQKKLQQENKQVK